jgi:hypothetical protein
MMGLNPIPVSFTHNPFPCLPRHPKELLKKIKVFLAS